MRALSAGMRHAGRVCAATLGIASMGLVSDTTYPGPGREDRGGKEPRLLGFSAPFARLQFAYQFRLSKALETPNTFAAFKCCIDPFGNWFPFIPR